MSETTTETAAATSSATELMNEATGSLVDIMEQLGLPPEDAATSAAGAKAAAESSKAAEKAAKDSKPDAKGDEAKDDAKAEAAGEEDPLAELAAIRQRNKERKRAKEAVRAGRAAPAAEVAKPAAAAKAETPAEKVAEATGQAPLSAGGKEVAAAVRDVLEQIAKMTADDEVATAAGGANKEQTDKRAADLKAMREQIDKIGVALGESQSLKGKFGALEEQIKNAATQKSIERMIDVTIDRHSASLPNLSAKRNAVDLVYSAADRFYTKHGYAPDLRFVAEKVEAVLSRSSDTSEKKTEADTSGAKAGEKRNTKTNTLTDRHATPPAKRKGPDARTSQEVIADLAASFGMDPDELR